MSQAAHQRNLQQSVSLAALFVAFLTVSLCGFGGGIVWARRIAVEKRRWISEQEFADIVSLCQFMPGPSIVGIAVCIGAKRGARSVQSPRSPASLSSHGESGSRSASYTSDLLT